MDFSDCGSIEDIQLKQELLQSSSIVDTPNIYHYTSQAGFNGILNEDSINLRFTRIDFLNDTTEGVHIIEYYKYICDTLLSEKIIGKEFYNEIKMLEPLKQKCFLKKSTKHFLEGKSTHELLITGYATYVFCFSKNRDSLPLWNYYLKSGKYDGYVLGFDVEDIKRQFHYCNCNSNALYKSELIVVEYDDAEKNDILSDYIQALHHLKVTRDMSLEKIKLAISCELTKWQYGFKQVCFSHECEVRLLIYVPLSTQNRISVNLNVEHNPYDPNKNLPTYIYIPLTDKCNLREVILPPTKDIDERVESLKMMGYSFNTQKSIIPVRF